MIPVISIIVPAYHAGEFIKDAIGKKIQILKSIKVPFELILVMDGSDKISSNEVSSFLKLDQFKLVYLKHNHGKGFAVRRGMQQAKGKYVGYIDVDNDIDPMVIKDMYDAIIINNYSVVLPSKSHPESKINYPLKRKMFSKIYNFIVHNIFGLQISDSQLGAKLYTKDALQKVLSMCTINGFAFELEMLLYAKKFNKLKFIEIPVVVNYKTQTTISIKNGLIVLLDTFKLFLRIKNFETNNKEFKKIL